MIQSNEVYVDVTVLDLVPVLLLDDRVAGMPQLVAAVQNYLSWTTFGCQHC